MRRRWLAVLLFSIFGFILGFGVYGMWHSWSGPLLSALPSWSRERQAPSQMADLLASPSATPVVSPTPTPTPRPPTFAELNAQYGPCAIVPTLMYHHVQDEATAKADGHAQLTVATPNFRGQMEYLRDHGYSVITMAQLLAFFDQGTALPKKSVLLTFDDGYDDMASDAWPILQELHFPATWFIPTGLMENAGYLRWSQIKDIAQSGLVLMANHTWSHHTMAGSVAAENKEIDTAKTQLAERGLDTPHVFAYPYGTVGKNSTDVVTQAGYTLAFTTRHGSTLCKGQRLILPRIRIGNARLSSYGL
jgi:peptidoglycan/xylan/chitin deacetylase (PgdA/CDA1 family)